MTRYSYAAAVAAAFHDSARALYGLMAGHSPRRLIPQVLLRTSEHQRGVTDTARDAYRLLSATATDERFVDDDGITYRYHCVFGEPSSSYVALQAVGRERETSRGAPFALVLIAPSGDGGRKRWVVAEYLAQTPAKEIKAVVCVDALGNDFTHPSIIYLTAREYVSHVPVGGFELTRMHTAEGLEMRGLVRLPSGAGPGDTPDLSARRKAGTPDAGGAGGAKRLKLEAGAPGQ